MKQFQKSANPAATRSIWSTLWVFVLLALIPFSTQAETIAEEAQKITAAAKAGEMFARMTEEQKAAESVQGYVMQGLGLMTILLLIFMAMLIWLIRRGAVGPFIKRPEEQG